MANCPHCAPFAEPVQFPTQRDYQDLVRRLIEAVAQGRMRILEASCPLEDVLQPVWPDDVVVHRLYCAACGKQFNLRADTYHGNGSWRPL
jgi:hypothetical protein